MEGPLRRHLHVTAMADLHAVRRELHACMRVVPRELDRTVPTSCALDLKEK